MKNLLKTAFFALAAALAGSFGALPALAAPDEAGAPAKADSPWEKMFPDGLIKAGQKASAAKPENVKSLDGKFVGVYRSASWCGPCRKFTPRLVKFYAKNKKDLEIVFWSADRSEDDMRAYVKADKMKWLAVPFGKSADVKFPGGIPNLFVFAPDGSLLANIGGAYAGSGEDPRLVDLLKKMKEWRENHAEK